jgi:hypothetical protein
VPPSYHHAYIQFLNLTVDEEKVVDLQIREPYATLLKIRKNSNGRQEATDIELLEPLANSILQHWDFTSLAEQFTDLDKLFKASYNVEYAY